MSEESFRGNELRVRREEMGLSREDVFRKLRIPIDVVEQIESGRMKPLPSLTYSIGFIKTYCDLLGINSEPYISELVMSRRERKSLIEQAVHGNAKDQPVWLRELIMWSAIIAIIVLGWVAYSIMFQPSSSDSTSQVQADTVDIRVPQFPMR
ncbi:MAG TPA: helix-turn-helix domain-containing protein [Candidatus Hydrogenedentes bacterium]|nr:helix-turn-helix domain-containing protein [Candidatus Hydrogenedentota bacterium]